MGHLGLASGCNPSAATPETCNLFKFGQTPGIIPSYQNFGEGVKAYHTDFNNWAPSVGVNWTPSPSGGFLRKLFGEQGDTSFSGGWSRGYERHGMSDFTGVFSNNPGLTVNANRNLTNNNLGPLPLLLPGRQPGSAAVLHGSRHGRVHSRSPTYPIATTGTGSINIFDPNIQVPYSDSWTVGVQRAVSRRSAIEVRYIGTRNRDQWTNYNYNELNIISNGFFDEFKNAQNNLYAHIAQGCGGDSNPCSFAYRGPGTGTVPLPIYLAHCQRHSDVGRRKLHERRDLRHALRRRHVDQRELRQPALALQPQPVHARRDRLEQRPAGHGDVPSNAIAAGLPRNFFLANPDARAGANTTGNGGFTSFNGLQTQYRRRLSDGLQFDVNYAFGKAMESRFYSFRVPRVDQRNTGGEGDVTHAMKGTFVYELPFGAGRRYGSGMSGWMDRIVGGWQIRGTFRVQTGALIDLGNVRVVGMSMEEAQDAFKFRQVSDSEMYMWPDDIIDNTIKAYSRDLNGFTRGTPTGRLLRPVELRQLRGASSRRITGTAACAPSCSLHRSSGRWI